MIADAFENIFYRKKQLRA